MKQKRIISIVAFSLVALVITGLAWVRYDQLKPVVITSGTKPLISYNNSDNIPPALHPTMSDKAKQQADAPGPKQPTIQLPQPPEITPIPQRTTNAPKQDDVRKSVDREYTYYPLIDANDPGYPASWALQKVNAPAAWNISTGNGKTVVAVIDTGFALNHEDLKNNWFTNSGETGMTKPGDRCWTGIPQDKSTNNCDDDGNGYIDDWRGWNFYKGDNNPAAGRINPAGVAAGHGTETAGLVGASGNNGVGIATINWNTKIMPLQVLSDDGPGYTSDIAAAIYYAVDNGATVINLSLGGSAYDANMKAATDYAFSHNVVVVAAAGNCGSGTEQGCQGLSAGTMFYPALNDHVIAVGATTIDNQRASFSSYGPGLDIVAPGSGTIVSPTWTSTNATTLYAGALYGTSFAAPQVASLASLIKSIRPNSSIDDVTALILGSATKLPAMNGLPYVNELGHGLINASAALTAASSLNSVAATPKLAQAGGSISEHQYASSDVLGSGCSTAAASYCTIWLRNDQTGYDRYLPYQQANTQGASGWTWSGAILPAGSWQIRAVQGDYRSAAYSLSNK